MDQAGRAQLAVLLGEVKARIEAINSEKAELVEALSEMLAAARADLTNASAPKAGRQVRQRRGRRRVGFRMSEEAKARISAAAKKRWAAWKTAQK